MIAIRFVMIGVAAAAGLCASVASGQQVPTTPTDYHMPGTQPNTMGVPPLTAMNCANCHAYYAEAVEEPVDNEPFSMWSASMMGQAGRDPIFFAALYVANQDAAFAGEFCLRCHAPQGWLQGRSSDPTGASLTDEDREGVACSVCHHMVNPSYSEDTSPGQDLPILQALAAAGNLPVTSHSGQMVLDPNGLRRGPYAITQSHAHPAVKSPYHRQSEMCGTCHDIGNPLYAKQPDGTYALTPMNQEAPSADRYQQFPIERTYSEWLNSSFAQGPIDMGGRFGGNNPSVSSCQDCHMPKTGGYGCEPGFGAEYRSDLPRHYFAGANTWVLKAVRDLYPDWMTFLSEERVDDAIARAEDMLGAASDMEVTYANNQLAVRIINQTGHKLPTGYNEGRRMWINVRFYNLDGNLISELGGYDYATGALDTESTKVYEAKAGIDAAVAAATGKPQGESFHFALNNQWLFDNRIPPRGFTNANFAAVNAAPVAYTYADGQYWDDTTFNVPPAAAFYEIAVYHQTTSKEYIEFLRDIYPGNTAAHDSYALWNLYGREKLALMDYTGSELPTDRCPADYTHDGAVDGDDVIEFFALWDSGEIGADFTGDGGVDGDDVIEFFGHWDSGC
ncbi:MAG: GC-type dockerin domain-anchored protein [Phycisphaerales bacterium]